METAIALILANIAAKFVVSGEMPKVPYRTLCDYYMDLCFFNQVLVALLNAVVHMLSQRWVYPGVFSDQRTSKMRGPREPRLAVGGRGAE